MKFLKLLISVFVFLLVFVKISFAENVKISDIIIQGNQKISSNTIVDLLDLKNNLADSKSLNEYQKKLFQINFFKLVEVSFNDSKIFINLKENPIIDYVFIEGIKSDKLLNDIKDLVDLKENTLFSEVTLNFDIKKISTFFSSQGYFRCNI